MEGSLVAYKVFTNGSVLNASEINDNLMNQSVIVFSNAAARTAAITSPVEGQMTYLEDTNNYENWDGSSWVNFFGLRKISSTSFTAASVVNIDNVFTSQYENYKICFYANSAGAPGFTFLRFRSGGVTNSSANYINGTSRMNSAGVYSSGAISNTATTSNLIIDNTAGNRIVTFDLFRPQMSSVTLGSGSFFSAGGLFLGWCFPGYNATDQFDGFAIAQDTSNFTGKIDVYGYGS
jgi:hypothetical protein